MRKPLEIGELIDIANEIRKHTINDDIIEVRLPIEDYEVLKKINEDLFYRQSKDGKGVPNNENLKSVTININNVHFIYENE